MIETAAYCREIEAYLCRKNEGHLIRIVGPVFEQVAGWAAQGVPLPVVFRGIDQYFERYYAKGPRRRPVRIEFCEADILDLFDAWRRAVGVPSLGVEEESERKRDSLASHVDRAIARLTSLRAGNPPPALDAALERTVRELDAGRVEAKQSRGAARAALLERLAALDRELLEVARTEIDHARRDALRADAEAEIAPFASRMPPAAKATAVDAAFERLLRDAFGLPILTVTDHRRSGDQEESL
jgi:vacuolar-type H+-ATPase subunit H